MGRVSIGTISFFCPLTKKTISASLQKSLFKLASKSLRYRQLLFRNRSRHLLFFLPTAVYIKIGESVHVALCHNLASFIPLKGDRRYKCLLQNKQVSKVTGLSDHFRHVPEVVRNTRYLTTQVVPKVIWE